MLRLIVPCGWSARTVSSALKGSALCALVRGVIVIKARRQADNAAARAARGERPVQTAGTVVLSILNLLRGCLRVKDCCQLLPTSTAKFNLFRRGVCAARWRHDRRDCLRRGATCAAAACPRRARRTKLSETQFHNSV